MIPFKTHDQKCPDNVLCGFLCGVSAPAKITAFLKAARKMCFAGFCVGVLAPAKISAFLKAAPSTKKNPGLRILPVWEVSHVSDNCHYYHEGEHPGNTAVRERSLGQTDRGVGRVIRSDGTPDSNPFPADFEPILKFEIDSKI
jgi:hypothetical protein